MSAVFEVSGLSKAFGGLKVNSDISLTMNEGERLALIGPNGADQRHPVEGVDRGDDVLKRHEDHRADQRAIEMADAAEHQHDESVRGHLEAHAVEPDDLRGDGCERAAMPATVPEMTNILSRTGKA